MNYCTHCSGPLKLTIPSGDDRPRYICRACGTIHYQNPKMVVGCIPVLGEQILMCRRAIPPRYGLWTIPAGYLENDETVIQGAKRETWEEARADIEDLTAYRLFNIPHISQMYLIFRAALVDPHFRPGAESLEVELFSYETIPWNELAFQVIHVCLKHFFRDRQTGDFSFQIDKILPDDHVAW